MVRKKLSRVSRDPARKTFRVRGTWVVRRNDEGEAQRRSWTFYEAIKVGKRIPVRIKF
jgi:hypothetical protein